MKITRMDQANGSLQATADLSPAYSSGVKSWQREVDFSLGKLIVHDSFTTDADTQAVFQINVPVKPVLEGYEARVGKLHVKVLKPADAVLSTLDFSSLDKGEFRSGWRIDVRGSGNEFQVELAQDAP